MTGSSAELRHTAASVALLGAFAFGGFFFGVGDNLVILVLVAALLLFATSLLSARSLIVTARESPLATGVAVGALLVLVLNVQTSLSKDSSFGPAWVLAAGPMSFIVASGVGVGDRRQLLFGVTAMVALVAAVSFARLLLYGERASLPLTDPNNYATLMYLVWIPFVHHAVALRWRARAVAARFRAIEYVVAFLLLAALFATQSRTSLIVVGAALLFWVYLASARRQSLMGPLVHAVIAALALITVLLLSPADLVTNRIATVGAGIGVRVDLVDAGWRMYWDHPITGVGVFCFNLVYSAYRPLSEQLTAGLFVHNDYVQMLAEGGVLLAVLPLAMAIGAARAVANGLRADVDAPSFDRLGPALAVTAACAHALVNFVFYTLSLGILIGLLAAAMVDRAPSNDPRPLPFARIGIAGAIAFGWLAWSYLALDLVTVAVFQGQRGVPFSETIRNDPARQLRYARLAQRLNPDRGIPVLGEAMLLVRQSDAANGSLDADTLARFRGAIAVDPWNPLGYIALADFLAKRGDRLTLHDDESPTTLLLKALAIDPVNVVAIDQLLALNRQNGRLGDSYALFRNIVFPWLELLKRQDDKAADRYLDEMMDLAGRAGDSAFAEAITQKRAALERVAPKVYRRWFE